MAEVVTFHSSTSNLWQEKFISDPKAEKPEENKERSDCEREVRKVLATLNLREEEIVRFRFGITDLSKHLKKLAKLLI